jgi:hypothetical protein
MLGLHFVKKKAVFYHQRVGGIRRPETLCLLDHENNLTITFEIFYTFAKFRIDDFSLLNEISFSRFLEEVDSKNWGIHLRV